MCLLDYGPLGCPCHKTNCIPRHLTVYDIDVDRTENFHPSFGATLKTDGSNKSEKLSWEKTFMNFEVLWLISKVFFMKYLLAAPASNL